MSALPPGANPYVGHKFYTIERAAMWLEISATEMQDWVSWGTFYESELLRMPEGIYINSNTIHGMSILKKNNKLSKVALEKLAAETITGGWPVSEHNPDAGT